MTQTASQPITGKRVSTFDDVDVICPHCGYRNGDASDWCKDTEPFQSDCDACRKQFTCWADYSVMYHAEAMIEQESPPP